MNFMKLYFPKGFLWGTSTSAYQVEGGIEDCDWSKKFPAGKACDHYNRYEEDFDLLERLNQNAHRFSIEWSRVQPKEGEFNEFAINHYREVLNSLKRRGIKAMVTLHHFTSPVWFVGWDNPKSVSSFTLFAERMFKEYGDLVDFWITINEPSTYCSKGFLAGDRPPFKKGIFAFKRAIKNQILAHKEIFELFHQINGKARVGVAKEMNFFEPKNESSFLDKMSKFLADYFWNEYFVNKIEKHLDFIGLNYYFHNRIKFPCNYKGKGKVVSDLGWEIYPEGIYHVLLEMGEYGLPIYITENGLADKEDVLRRDFIKDHLAWAHRAIEEGVDVRGYFHWSLIDNFEWDKGFWPRFGLVEVDRESLERRLRPSSEYYAQICKNNYIN